MIPIKLRTCAYVIAGMPVLAMASCSDSNDPVCSTPTPPTATAHENVVLVDRLGNPITATSKEPYSPRMTCGGCHDMTKIANAYHFQQGRTDLAGNIVVKEDYFGDGREWLLSAGMYGKW